MSDFRDILNAEVELIDAIIRKEFENTSRSSNIKLTEAMEYSLFSGGKRIRPLLLKWFAEIGDPQEKVLDPALAAIEYIHTYSLIHDDLPAMDDDNTRRGKPTSHVKFGEAIAILAGDSLLTEAFRLLAKTGSIRLIYILSECSGARGMVGGQASDILIDTDIIETNELKTAKLFVAAAQMGAVAGGLEEVQITSAEKYGINIGRAFQLRDDILDGDFLSRKKTEARARRYIEAAKSALGRLPGSEKLLDLAEFVIERSH